LLEANADHGVAAAAAATTTTTTTADNARPGQRLLTDMRSLGRGLRTPRLLLLADRLLAPPRVVFVLIGLARGCSRCRFRLLVGDAGFAPQGLAGFALERADPGRVLGQFGDQRFGHAWIGG